MYNKCISDTYPGIYVNAYYNEQSKSTRSKGGKTDILGVRYIIID